MEVIAKIETSERYCNEILERCRRKLGHEIEDETFVTLCEALLHFMLIASMLPYQRKVKWNVAELDVVVPSLKSLTKNPRKSLIIQIVKRNAEVTKIEEAESVQPCSRNIWIVSARPLKIEQKNYYVGSTHFPYFVIINDINAFLVAEGSRWLKQLQG